MPDFIDKYGEFILQFFGKKSNGLDIIFLSKIINLQDKLELTFPDNNNLGAKYDKHW